MKRDTVERTTVLLEGLTPPYATIVADPPWRYTEGPQAATTGRRGAPAEARYSTMTMAEVAALPVKGLSTDNAHLYLWVTNPRLFGDYKDSGVGPRDIIQAWGFQYQTLLTWVKTGAPGMGFYFRGMTEHVLFCTRGKAPIPAELRESNVITAARTRHSAKPPAFLDLVQRVSPGPYVELFARQPRFGWDSWGWGYEKGA